MVSQMRDNFRDRRLNPYLVFLAIAALVAITESVIAHSIIDPDRHARIGIFATLDLTLVVPALYYWLLVKSGRRSMITMFFVAVMGLWRAAFLFPEVIPGKIWIGSVLEAALLAAAGTALWESRRVFGGSDPVELLRDTFGRIIPVPAIARIMASECAVLYYGLFSWRARQHVPVGTLAFTMDGQSTDGSLFLGLGILSLLEIAPAHLIVRHWSAATAWVFTGLSLYGSIWMVAIARSLRLRPALVSLNGIAVRYGLLFNLWIPASRIRAVRFAGDRTPGAYIIPRRTDPEIYLEFTEPLNAGLLAGLHKLITAIGLTVDDPGGFKTAIQDLWKDRRAAEGADSDFTRPPLGLA